MQERISRPGLFWLFLFLLSLPLALVFFASSLWQGSAQAELSGSTQSTAGPTIREVGLNLKDYSNGTIPRYKKVEITFQVDTTAANLGWPYDPNPPAGLMAGQGVTVNGLFSPDNWKTVYTQPAFYTQILSNEALSSNHAYAWKVRFSPNQEGNWQFKISAQDASGFTETDPQFFLVGSSSSMGFVRISQRDPRYYEFEDGTYFPGLGFNLNNDLVDGEKLLLDDLTSAQEAFIHMSQNGIQQARVPLMINGGQNLFEVGTTFEKETSLGVNQGVAYAFDQMVALAEETGIYLRPLLIENDNYVPENISQQVCLQQAQLRYMQARWGYSTAILSWDLVNEDGSVVITNTDKLGKYMSQFQPNHHTIFFSTGNSALNGQVKPEKTNTELAQQLIDYETEHLSVDGSHSTQIADDIKGIWLHQLIWERINAEAMTNAPGWNEVLIYKRSQDGTYLYDFRPHFRSFYNFIRQVPLNNGQYQNALATVTTQELRVWGQKDVMNGRAHLWIQNSTYGWQAAAAGTPVQPVSGSVILGGLKPGAVYAVQVWDTYQFDPTKQVLRTENFVAQPDGSLVLPVKDLISDIAVQIWLLSNPPASTSILPLQ